MTKISMEINSVLPELSVTLMAYERKFREVQLQ